MSFETCEKFYSVCVTIYNILFLSLILYLNRVALMEKLCRIIGAENYDPDKTYELTADNVKKMLAIYMRFRYIKFKNFCFV